MNKIRFKKTSLLLLSISIFLILLNFPFPNALATPTFTEHTIDGSLNGAWDVYPCDIDSDGDIDILVSGYVTEVSWYENDGSESFTKRTIDSSAIGAQSVYACDMDGDDDIDVLASLDSEDSIVWYENNGAESFSQHTIDGSFSFASSVYAADVDSDGDMDVLGTAWSDDDITWWENDGSESFTEHTIDGSYYGAQSVYACDLDGDDDIDVLGASHMGHCITWFENDGSESFTEHTIGTGFVYASSVYAIDVDSDGDMDVLGSSKYNDEIAWWENDGSESFTKRTISDSFDEAWDVYACDIDGDDDVDVLGAAYAADEIAWFENDGSESFTEHILNADLNGARSVYACDLDGDDDMDVLGTACEADDLIWWEIIDTTTGTPPSSTIVSAGECSDLTLSSFDSITLPSGYIPHDIEYAGMVAGKLTVYICGETEHSGFLSAYRLVGDEFIGGYTIFTDSANYELATRYSYVYMINEDDELDLYLFNGFEFFSASIDTDEVSDYNDICLVYENSKTYVLAASDNGLDLLYMNGTIADTSINDACYGVTQKDGYIAASFGSNGIRVYEVLSDHSLSLLDSDTEYSADGEVIMYELNNQYFVSYDTDDDEECLVTAKYYPLHEMLDVFDAVPTGTEIHSLTVDQAQRLLAFSDDADNQRFFYLYSDTSYYNSIEAVLVDVLTLSGASPIELGSGLLYYYLDGAVFDSFTILDFDLDFDEDCYEYYADPDVTVTYEYAVTLMDDHPYLNSTLNILFSVTPTHHGVSGGGILTMYDGSDNVFGTYTVPLSTKKLLSNLDLDGDTYDSGTWKMKFDMVSEVYWYNFTVYDDSTISDWYISSAKDPYYVGQSVMINYIIPDGCGGFIYTLTAEKWHSIVSGNETFTSDDYIGYSQYLEGTGQLEFYDTIGTLTRTGSFVLLLTDGYAEYGTSSYFRANASYSVLDVSSQGEYTINLEEVVDFGDNNIINAYSNDGVRIYGSNKIGTKEQFIVIKNRDTNEIVDSQSISGVGQYSEFFDDFSAGQYMAYISINGTSLARFNNKYVLFNVFEHDSDDEDDDDGDGTNNYNEGNDGSGSTTDWNFIIGAVTVLAFAVTAAWYVGMIGFLGVGTVLTLLLSRPELGEFRMFPETYGIYVIVAFVLAIIGMKLAK